MVASARLYRVHALAGSVLAAADTVASPSLLSAPLASFVSSTATQIQLSASPAVGGSGSYTYQWHRGTSAGFTPSSQNVLAGATSLSLTDTAGLSPGTPYFYILEANDGSTSIFSNQVIGALSVPTTPIALPYQPGSVVLGYIGSSTWAINQGSGQVPALIDQDLRAAHPGISLTTLNGAVSGTKTTDYLPGTPSFNSIKSQMQAATGYKVLRLMIGSNDAAAGVPTSTWQANMQAIINDAATWADKIVLEEIGVRLDTGNSTLELIRQYNAARANLVGGKVVLGTAYTYENQATHLNTLSSDNIHQTDAGQQNLALNQATETDSLFTPQQLWNGSFETTSANGYTYDPVGTGWNITGNAGIQANGSAFGAINAPDGSQTAFLQSSGGNPATVGQISQSIAIGAAGTYTISFKAALRSYRFGTTAPQQVAVYIDGNLVNTFSPTSTTSWDTFSHSQNLTAGTHTLTFKAALANGDTTAFIDAIGLALTSPSLANGSFEATNANGYTYDPTGTGWNITGNAGIQANGSAFGAINAPDGTQTAFLQSSMGNPATVGQVSQSFAVGAAGTYSLAFKAALRSYRFGTTAPQQIAVYVDGNLANTFAPTSTTSWDSFSLLQNLTAGTHTLTFKAALAAGDTTAFLDATSISLAPPAVPPALANGSFETTSANGYTYDPTGAGWTFTGNAGIQANGSAFGAINAPDGTQTAFLQSSMGNPATVGQISQGLTINAGGTFTFAFKAALRSYRTGTTAPQQIAVYIDGNLVNTFSPTSTTSWDSFSFSQNLTVGPHTLTFKAALPTGDTTAFLDAVQVS